MSRKSERRRAIDCRRVEAALTAYLKDGLMPARRQIIEDHLAACAACSRSVQQAQTLESELRIQAARHNPTLSPEASVRIHERVYKRMRRALIMQRTVKLAGAAVAVATIVLLAVGAMAFWPGTTSDVGIERSVTPEVSESAPTSVPATDTAIPPTSTSLPPTATPVSPTDTPEPSSCEGLEETCLELTFDGETCAYAGPTLLEAGPVTLYFHNDSEEVAGMNLGRHTGDETIQDVIDSMGEERLTLHALWPPWVLPLGVYRRVPAGESQRWEGELEPGIHSMMCVEITPLGTAGGTYRSWFGTGLTVEDTPIAPAAVPVTRADSPESTWCEDEEGTCLELSFDGESCSYQGPTLLKAGPVTLLFHNSNEEAAAMNLGKHTGDETIQDYVDYRGEEPWTEKGPSWVLPLGVYRRVPAGESQRWEGDLDLGIYSMVCVELPPEGTFGGTYATWFGTGLTVEE